MLSCSRGREHDPVPHVARERGDPCGCVATSQSLGSCYVRGIAQPASRVNGVTVMIALVQATVPAYRQPAFKELARRLPDLRVIHGHQYFDPSITSVDPADSFASVSIQNHYLFGRRVLWQSGVWRHARSATAVIVELNPRNLTSWVVLLALRPATVILWGQAWSRRGRGARSNSLRRLMRRLASAVVLYTVTEAEEMAADGEEGEIFVAPNGLYPRPWLEAVAIPAVGSSEPRPGSFVVSSRLVESKKVDLVIRALRVARSEYGVDACLAVVGDGPKRDKLVDVARREGIVDSVTFWGAIYDRRELLDIYLRSSAAVIPGYAGLSLIQALNFGRPAIVAAGEPHAPEIEAASHPGACHWFTSGDVESLAACLAAIASDPPSREVAMSLASWSSATYSTDSVADGLQAAVERFSRDASRTQRR